MSHKILTLDELVNEYVDLNQKYIKQKFQLIYETDKVKQFQIYNSLRLTFWDYEIVISGDSLDPDSPNGIISNRGYSLNWFLNQYKSPFYLCSKFLTKTYDPHNMYLFLDQYLQSEESFELNDVAKENIHDIMNDFIKYNDGLLVSSEQIYDFLVPHLGHDTVIENINSYNHLAYSRLVGINQLFSEIYLKTYGDLNE